MHMSVSEQLVLLEFHLLYIFRRSVFDELYCSSFRCIMGCPCLTVLTCLMPRKRGIMELSQAAWFSWTGREACVSHPSKQPVDVVCWDSISPASNACACTSTRPLQGRPFNHVLQSAQRQARLSV